MDSFFNDPTSEDGDYFELTPEETKAIYKSAAVMLLILVAAGIFIYLKLW